VIEETLADRISVKETTMKGGKAMVTNKGFGGFVLSACMMFFALTLLGCIVAVPLIIHATRGSSTSTATVLIDRDAATVYANAVKVVKPARLYADRKEG
jgi:hypothetical protein